MSLRWGIVGYGRAGRARARAVQADPRSILVGAHRGQPEADGVQRFSDLDALMARCDAVAICTPNATHPALVSAALRAGLHVACDFPLAGAVAEARALFDLADAQGLVLHVEHIELLGAADAAMRRHARGRPVASGELSFTSSASGWLGDPALALPVPHRNIARLQRLLSALGPASLDAVSVRDDHQLSARVSAAGGLIALRFEHGEGLPRHTRFALRFVDGGALVQDGRGLRLDDALLDLPPSPPLFAADHANAAAQILDGAAPYIDRDQLLAGLQLADDLAHTPLSSP